MSVNLRTLVSRVSASLRRSKPCGCPRPADVRKGVVPEAHRVNDKVTDEGEYVVEYRCSDCGGTFELSEGAFLERDFNE
jgi:hypothetical protein